MKSIGRIYPQRNPAYGDLVISAFKLVIHFPHSAKCFSANCPFFVPFCRRYTGFAVLISVQCLFPCTDAEVSDLGPELLLSSASSTSSMSTANILSAVQNTRLNHYSHLGEPLGTLQHDPQNPWSHDNRLDWVLGCTLQSPNLNCLHSVLSQRRLLKSTNLNWGQ